MWVDPVTSPSRQSRPRQPIDDEARLQATVALWQDGRDGAAPRRAAPLVVLVPPLRRDAGGQPPRRLYCEFPRDVGDAGVLVARSSAASLAAECVEEQMRCRQLQDDGQWEEALRASRGAVAASEEWGDPVAIALCHVQRLALQTAPGGAAAEPDNAVRELLQRAACRDTSAKTLGDIKHHLAWLLERQGNWQAAHDAHLQTLPVRERAADRRGRAMTQARLAECLVRLHRPAHEVRVYLDPAMAFCERAGMLAALRQLRETKAAMLQAQDSLLDAAGEPRDDAARASSEE